MYTQRASMAGEHSSEQSNNRHTTAISHVCSSSKYLLGIKLWIAHSHKGATACRSWIQHKGLHTATKMLQARAGYIGSIHYHRVVYGVVSRQQRNCSKTHCTQHRGGLHTCASREGELDSQRHRGEQSEEHIIQHELTMQRIDHTKSAT